MVKARRGLLADTLRRRILRGIQIEALAPGDRLPGTRELAIELEADPRVVAAAYRTLASEGLVELRPRAGAFVATTVEIAKRRAGLTPDWIANVYAEAVERGVAIADLPGALSAPLSTRTIRAVVVATTLDQTLGLCRELEECYSLSCHGVSGDLLVAGEPVPRALARAQLIVTTTADSQRIRSIAKAQDAEFLCIALRPDLYTAEFALLRGEHTYIVVADPRFAKMTRDYLAKEGGADSVDVLVAGQDDLTAIPTDAPVYVTGAAREQIGRTRLPNGLLPTTRVLSPDCSREIVAAMLRIAAR